MTHCHRTWCQWRGCCILYIILRYFSQILPSLNVSWALHFAVSRRCQPRQRRVENCAKYFQASKDRKYYLYLARHSVLVVLVNERDDDTCACLRTFAVSTGCVLRTATAGFHRCSCKFHIFEENNHLSSYTRKERRALEAMTDRERRRLDWER